MTWWMALLQSRKFWISVVGLVSVVAVSLGYDALPEAEIVQAIVTIVSVLVGSIAAEDVATKLRQ